MGGGGEVSDPQFEYTDELHEALDDFTQQRTDLVVAGIDLERISEFVDAVRRVDAELIAARHVHRNGEFYPYYPESYQAEEDGLEDAEKLLRGPMPERQEREVVVVHAFPPDGSGLTACCKKTPFEIARTDRMTQVAALVNCEGVGQ
jgi:hypothetical protein